MCRAVPKNEHSPTQFKGRGQLFVSEYGYAGSRRLEADFPDKVGMIYLLPGGDLPLKMDRGVPQRPRNLTLPYARLGTPKLPCSNVARYKTENKFQYCTL